MEKISTGVNLDRETSLSEVNLNFVSALSQAGTYLSLMFAEQVVNELLAGIVRELLRWVHKSQSRGRDNRLLHGHVSVAQGVVQVAVSVPIITERTARQTRNPTRVAGSERNLESVGRRIGQPLHAVRQEIVILSLLAVGNYR